MLDSPAPQGYVMAFDPVDGSQAWRYPADPEVFIGGVASTPAIFDNGAGKSVVFGSNDGKVYCLDAGTGASQWSFQTESRNPSQVPPHVLASPVVYGGHVYIGNESARMYCLDASTGQQIWMYEISLPWPARLQDDVCSTTSAAIGNVDETPYLYVRCDDGKMYCLSLEDNPAERVEWSLDVVAPIESSPLVFGDYVYFGATFHDGFPNFYAVDKGSGVLRWSRALSWYAVHGSPTAIRDGVYIGTDADRLYRMNPSSGRTDPLSDNNPLNALVHGYLALDHFFMGTAALTRSGLAFVGNDGSAVFTLSTNDLSVLRIINTGGPVRSTPAVTYAAQAGYRWVYVRSRENGGALRAYRQLR